MRSDRLQSRTVAAASRGEGGPWSELAGDLRAPLDPLRVNAVHRIVDAAIVESWHLEDVAGMLQQLGVKP